MQREIEQYSQDKNMFFHSVGENVVLIPKNIQNLRLKDIVLPYQSSPLIHVIVSIGNKQIHIISWKLTHGVFYARTMLRKKQLKQLLGIWQEQPMVIAVDANAPSKREQRTQEKIAQKYGFETTRNNITYILERLEPKSLAHRFGRLWGRVFKTKNELDRMFYSWLKLIDTKVHEYVTSSDHIPVFAKFSLEEKES